MPNDDEDNELGVTTYRAKVNSIGISPRLRRSADRPRSYSITSSQGSVRSALLVEQESVSESCSGTTTPIYSPQSSQRNLKDQSSSSAESGYSTGSSNVGGGRVTQSSINEESSSEAGGKTEQTQDNQTSSTAASGTAVAVASTAAVKRVRPLTRRNTSAVSNPSRTRGVSHPVRSRLESESGGAPLRKKALSPTGTPNRRLLPATPVRRSEKAHLAATRPRSPVTEGSEAGGGVPRKIISKERGDQVDSTTASSSSSPTPADPVGNGGQGSSSSSSRNSREGNETLAVQQPSTERKTKHTVLYKDSSPLYKDGESCLIHTCLLYTSPSPRDATLSRMPSSA